MRGSIDIRFSQGGRGALSVVQVVIPEGEPGRRSGRRWQFTPLNVIFRCISPHGHHKKQQQQQQQQPDTYG